MHTLMLPQKIGLAPWSHLSGPFCVVEVRESADGDACKCAEERCAADCHRRVGERGHDAPYRCGDGCGAYACDGERARHPSEKMVWGEFLSDRDRQDVPQHGRDAEGEEGASCESCVGSHREGCDGNSPEERRSQQTPIGSECVSESCGEEERVKWCV